MTVSFGAALAPHATSADRFDDVLGAAAELGLGHLRLAVPWAAMEPRAGSLDGTLVEQLRAAAQSCRSAGIEPWFLLLQPDVPRWFDDEGGWLDARWAGRAWPRWVETAAGQLGDLAAGWVPFEAPYAMSRRLSPGDSRRAGEVLDTLVVAWRDAWRILRGGTARVMTSLDVRTVRPADDSPEAADAARREDAARWSLWLRGFADGLLAVPGRAERQLADLQGATDAVGIAVTGEVETTLHRVAEMTAIRPLAVTFRAAGAEADRRGAIELLRRDVDRTAGELDVRWVSVVTGDLAADLDLLRA